MQNFRSDISIGQNAFLANSRLFRALKNLDDSQAKALLVTILDNSPLLVGYLDSQFRYTLISQKMAELAGVDAEELIGKTPFYQQPQLEKQLRPVFEAVVQTRKPFVAEGLVLKYTTPHFTDGTAHRWNLHIAPVMSDNDEPEGLVVVAEKTGEGPEVTSSLMDGMDSRSNSRLHAILSSINDGVVVMDPDGTVVISNSMADEIMKRPLLGTNLYKEAPDISNRRYLDGKPIPPEESTSARLLRNETFRNFRYVVSDATGIDHVISCNGSPVYSEQQEIIGSVALFSDVTVEEQRRHQLEEAHRTAEETQEALLELSAAVAGITDLDELLERIVQIMPVVSGCDRLGITLYDAESEELTPAAVYGIDPAGVPEWKATKGKRDRSSPYDAQIFEEHKLLEVDFGALVEASRAQGVEIPNPYNVKNMLVLPLSHQGELLGMITLDHATHYHTFTPRECRVLEGMARLVAIAIANVRLVQRARETAVLREANRLKDEFMSLVAHELRNPLTTIRGNAQLGMRQLGKAGLSANQLRYFDTILAQTARMNRLVEDLLDSERIEAGHIELVMKKTDLAELINNIAENFRQSSPLHSIKYNLAAITDHTPFTGYWDQDRLSQVISNLLSNAIKYSPKGGQIELRLERERLTSGSVSSTGVEAAEDVVHFSISDQGIGIPEDQQGQLFTRFYRAPNSRSSGVPGIGLGLHISQQIVMLHNGRMWVESSGENQGSTFHFVLPVGQLFAS
ncbi:MAG TPA: ATP-binding protein [Chloroflexia bacterium]|nr:ATP-binding protein [Chloroflexia bacterium]